MRITVTCFLVLIVSTVGFSQEIGYDIAPDYRKAITKDQLLAANSLKDINPGYPASWIDNYRSVVISTVNNGQSVSVQGDDQMISADQADILEKADLGSEITVSIKYVKKNSGEVNEDIREISFTYTVIPEEEATYIEGYDALKNYLKLSIVDKLSEEMAKGLKMASTTFYIDENGQATDIKINQSSDVDGVDELIIETLQAMTAWQPATLSTGTKVKQLFRFDIGNAIGC